MLHLIRNNSPYTVLILIIFTLIVKLQALSAPAVPVVLPDHFLYGYIVQALDVVLSGGASAYTMLAVLMQFGQALYLNNIATRRRMVTKPMYNIAFFYIVLTSLSPALTYFSELLLVNWLVLIALDVMLGIHQTPHPRKNVYNAGFFLSLAALLHFPAIGYALLLIFALMMLRSFNPGEWIVGLMGYITPIYFIGGILFLFDRFAQLMSWPKWSFWLTAYKVDNPVYTIGAFSGVVLLLLAGAFVLQGNMGKSSVFTRRNWSLISIYMFLSIVLALTTEKAISGAWLALMPSLAMIVSQPLYIEKNKRFSNFIFYFSLVLVIFCQVTFK
ncbi:MAG: hypothetical protein EOP56_12610 [Sphingobacteriales bacterium]|nr:MAG: hypothetical protein EOP56_12610 [Sphingobacteriales bacterium]